MKTKLVMFDYDGVLINSNHLPLLYYEKLAQEIGSKKFDTWDECREYLEVDFKITLTRLGIVNPEHVKKAKALFKSMDGLWRNLDLFPEAIHTFKQCFCLKVWMASGEILT